MVSQIESVSEHHVTQRAHLNADVSLDALLHQVWEQKQLEAVTDPFTVKQDGIVQVFDLRIVRLTRMEEGVHACSLWRVLDIQLCCKNLRHEGLNLISEILLVDKIETNDKVWVGLSSHLDVINHLLYVRLPHNLQSSDNQSQLEVWDSLLCFLNALVDDLELLHEAHWLTIIIEDNTRDVSQLNDEHILCNARVNSCLQERPKELVVLSKLGDSRELVLEVLPDVVRGAIPLLFLSQKNFVPQVVVEGLDILHELSHLHARDVAIVAL